MRLKCRVEASVRRRYPPIRHCGWKLPWACWRVNSFSSSRLLNISCDVNVIFGNFTVSVRVSVGFWDPPFVLIMLFVISGYHILHTRELLVVYLQLPVRPVARCPCYAPFKDWLGSFYLGRL